VKYTVVWEDLPLKVLGKLYLSAPDKAAVQQAADSIDKWLSLRPDLGIVDTESGLRELQSDPLRVLYRTSEDDCLVTVIGVRRSDQP
jgi:hypothetical protein